MGYSYVTAAKSIAAGEIKKITSVICTPLSNAAVSAQLTLYNATAATANTEIMHLRCGSAAQSVIWSDSIGIGVTNLWAAVGSAYATIVWD
ncbi:unnamed protein product [marine sediment metagenome]|uniref:Uncharacterized protein n=1 Tax=marine sediment metagenome TaxID=412755 RepID=X1UXG0_9ZZZZ